MQQKKFWSAWSLSLYFQLTTLICLLWAEDGPKTHRHNGASWEEKYEAGCKDAQKEALNLCFRQELWEAMLRGEPLADAVLVRPIILLFALGE